VPCVVVVDAGLTVSNPWLTGEGRAVLEAAVSDAVGVAVEAGVNAALDGMLGPASPTAPVVSPTDAAAAVLEELAVAHEHDLAAGEADVLERLSGRLSPEVVADPRAIEAVEWVLHADRGAHAVARNVLAGDLVDAFAGPVSERPRRVRALLDGERARMKARAGTRVARATRNLLAAVRLPDGALGPLP
jgi:hypothetical protein